MKVLETLGMFPLRMLSVTGYRKGLKKKIEVIIGDVTAICGREVGFRQNS